MPGLDRLNSEVGRFIGWWRSTVSPGASSGKARDAKRDADVALPAEAADAARRLQISEAAVDGRGGLGAVALPQLL